MKISNRVSYAYPIWGWRDDYTIDINDDDYSIVEIPDKDNFVYELDLKVHNKDIEALIEAEKAVFACVASCSETYYHKFTPSKEPKFVISIPRREVSGLVRVQWMIIATQDIMGYESDKLNDDYQGKANFPLGAMIGYITSFEINAELSDNLRSLDDIMKVVKNKDSNKIEYDFEDRIIKIKMPEKQLDFFNDYGSKSPYPSVMHSTIVYQALVLAISKIHNSNEDNPWVYTLRQCIDVIDNPDIPTLDDVAEDGYNLEQCISITNIILKDPFMRMMDDIDTEEKRH